MIRMVVLAVSVYGEKLPSHDHEEYSNSAFNH